jgi:HPt (histidine-containing phosphotransfer) domain-containing protein
MNNPGVHYMFSGRFDSAYLSELYANDIDTAQEIFESSINHIAIELNIAMSRFNSGDLEALRRVFHKMKPLFGYVGLPLLQDYVQRFEQRCSDVKHIEELRKEYEDIISVIGDTLDMLRQELYRMKSFNNAKVS